MSIQSKGFLYWNTLRYLRLSQITSRISKLLNKNTTANLENPIHADQREIVGSWIEPAKQSQRMFSANSFIFLNVSRVLNSVNDWNNRQWDKIWLYNLHYFDDLTAIDADQRVDWHRALMQRWIDENPPGGGNGWEPYPSSLRIVNWIKWALAGNALQEQWPHSLAVQIRYLSQNLETHLLGNHLFANAKALLFAGLFFEGDEAREWYKVGRELVVRELSEQVLSDGGNFELSTMYHMIFLEDLLDLVNIHHAYGEEIPIGLTERIPAMYNWLEAMCHPNGEISLFNDAALGITPTVTEIKNYGVRLHFLSLMADEKQHEGITDLPDSGYTRVEMGDVVALIDRAAVGPDYLPGHAHADTLSFELSLFGHRVIVNSGTSVYGTGEQRQLERGTTAHATVAIDGENSSEVWGGFRVARRARVFDREQSEVDSIFQLSACHDGYKRLSGKPVHCREWIFEEGLLTIHDRISGKGIHEVVSLLPLHPDVVVHQEEDSRVMLDVVGHPVEVSIEGEGKLDILESSYHPEFGLSVNSRKLVFQSKGTLTIEIITRIRW